MNKDLKKLINETINKTFAEAPEKLVERGIREIQYDICPHCKVEIYERHEYTEDGGTTWRHSDCGGLVSRPEMPLEQVDGWLRPFVKEAQEQRRAAREALGLEKPVKTKPSYADQIRMAWKKAQKEKNAEAMAYYELLKNTVANVPFEQFKGSWAYGEWIKKPEVIAKVKEIEALFKQFSWREEQPKQEPGGTMSAVNLENRIDLHAKSEDPEQDRGDDESGRPAPSPYNFKGQPGYDKTKPPIVPHPFPDMVKSDQVNEKKRNA